MSNDLPDFIRSVEALKDNKENVREKFSKMWNTFIEGNPAEIEGAWEGENAGTILTDSQNFNPILETFQKVVSEITGDLKEDSTKFYLTVGKMYAYGTNGIAADPYKAKGS